MSGFLIDEMYLLRTILNKKVWVGLTLLYFQLQIVLVNFFFVVVRTAYKIVISNIFQKLFIVGYFLKLLIACILKSKLFWTFYVKIHDPYTKHEGIKTVLKLDLGLIIFRSLL